MEFKGAYTALITPMQNDGELDWEGWRNLIRFQIEEGIDGLVPLGTTGENPTLGEDEEDKLLDIMFDEIDNTKAPGGKHVQVIIGTGSNDTKHAVAYTRRAKMAGADACLVVTPYYNKPNDSGLLRHFEEVAHVGLPVVVYNIAGRTGRNIPTPLMEKIAEIPGVIGVKEASGDVNQMADVIYKIAMPKRKAGKDFWVLSGDDGLTLPLMALGGDGVISVVSNLTPKRVKALVDACEGGRWDEARAMHYELLPLVKAAFIETNPTPIKKAMSLAGLPGGPARLPLGPISTGSEAVLKKAMADLGFKL
jgi:4-hydroxy-tetrahydrodipicolinate synthase